MYKENKDFINEVAPGCKWVELDGFERGTGKKIKTEFAFNGEEVFPVTNTDVTYPADMFSFLVDVIEYYNSISEEEVKNTTTKFLEVAGEKSADIIKQSEADFILSENEVKVILVRPFNVSKNSKGIIMRFIEENVPDIIIDNEAAKAFTSME